jgi:2,4-dienoyl-CoA reductase-like NADH-dependent reductase (Old Yellow Enzyme family)
MQLAHAGRKASSRAPWDGGQQIPSGDADGWLAEAPSAIPHSPVEEAPLALDAAGLARVRDAFATAAARAARLGLDGLEIHMAHGYLLHEFLSPLANRREDEYGGSLANRMRFPLEVFRAVRAAFPADRPVWVRVSATDWVDGGWDLDSSIALAKALKDTGCAAIHVSTGGVSPRQKIPLAPATRCRTPRASRPRSDCRRSPSAWSPKRNTPRPSWPAARPTPWAWPARCSTTRAGRGTRPRSWARRCVRPSSTGARSRAN